MKNSLFGIRSSDVCKSDFPAAFIGYSLGTAPVVSFHYGADNRAELKSLLKKSTVIIAAFAVCTLAAAHALSGTPAKIFTGYDEGLCDLTTRDFSIFSYSFLFAGFAIFGSGFFTALNNSLISAPVLLCFSPSGSPAQRRITLADAPVSASEFFRGRGSFG